MLMVAGNPFQVHLSNLLPALSLCPGLRISPEFDAWRDLPRLSPKSFSMEARLSAALPGGWESIR
jgi:hypothetical protein